MQGKALIALILLGRQIIGWVAQQASLLAAEGVISDEDLQAIKAAADLSDTAWDNIIANIRGKQ